MIIGELGVGKKLLAKAIDSNCVVYEASKLEKLLINKEIKTTQYNQLIIYNIDKVLNKNEFIENIKDIKIIATSQKIYQEYENKFAVKIELNPLKQRKEDLKELTSIYIKEANSIYDTSILEEDIQIDISQNGISLKKSIYKNVLFQSVLKDDISDMLYLYFKNKLDNGYNYKELLEIFEKQLLKASKDIYKSQLQISKELNINRITLRKKLTKYFGE